MSKVPHRVTTEIDIYELYERGKKRSEISRTRVTIVISVPRERNKLSGGEGGRTGGGREMAVREDKREVLSRASRAARDGDASKQRIS